MHANALHAVVLSELPGQIITRDKVAQARMKRGHMIIFKVDLDEGFPVVIALVHFNVIEHIVRKIKLWSLK
jgi:predicted amino acid racemase